MPTCQSCKSFVSNRFARVFGDNDNRILACPECANKPEIETQSRE